MKNRRKKAAKKHGKKRAVKKNKRAKKLRKAKRSSKKIVKKKSTRKKTTKAEKQKRTRAWVTIEHGGGVVSERHKIELPEDVNFGALVEHDDAVGEFVREHGVAMEDLEFTVGDAYLDINDTVLEDDDVTVRIKQGSVVDTNTNTGEPVTGDTSGTNEVGGPVTHENKSPEHGDNGD